MASKGQETDKGPDLIQIGKGNRILIIEKPDINVVQNFQLKKKKDSIESFFKH